jgi:hypothetical protein
VCGEISLTWSELCIALRALRCVALSAFGKLPWEEEKGRIHRSGMGGTYKLDFA